MVRIVALQSGSQVADKLKFDPFHVRLFAQSLHVVFEANEHLQRTQQHSQTSYTFVEQLPKGKVLGLMLFTDDYWYDCENEEHTSDPWHMGPYCIRVGDVCVLNERDHIACAGNLGLFVLSSRVIDKLTSLSYVLNHIQSWMQQYPNQLSLECRYSIYIYIYDDYI